MKKVYDNYSASGEAAVTATITMEMFNERLKDLLREAYIESLKEFYDVSDESQLDSGE